MCATNFRTAQIRKNANWFVKLPRNLAYMSIHPGMRSMFPMGHVQAKYVDTGTNKIGNDLWICRSRANCRDDLCTAVLKSVRMCHDRHR